VTAELDKRKQKRFEPRGLRCSMLSSRAVTVEDISLDGIRVTTQRGLAPAAEYRVRVWHDSGSVTLKGAVAWCILGSSNLKSSGERTPVYSAGIRFLDCTPEDRTILRRLINATCVGDRERRRYLRAVVDENHAVELTSPITGTVREINRGGMLVETGEEIKVGTKLIIDLHLDGGPLTVHCRVANSLFNEPSGLWFVGMEFQFFEAGGLERLSCFMDALENL